MGSVWLARTRTAAWGRYYASAHASYSQNGFQIGRAIDGMAFRLTQKGNDRCARRCALRSDRLRAQAEVLSVRRPDTPRPGLRHADSREPVRMSLEVEAGQLGTGLR